MGFDLAAALRRLKPQRIATVPLARRDDADLTFVEAVLPGPGAELMLDTCVYIDVLQGRTPPELDELLSVRTINHSTTSLSELTHLFGRMDPTHPDTKATLHELGGVVAEIPPHRLTRPSERAAGEAGMLAGLAARLAGRPHNIDLLNDTLLLLHAFESGCILLTRNLRDFDLLQQLRPQTSVLFYRQV